MRFVVVGEIKASSVNYTLINSLILCDFMAAMIVFYPTVTDVNLSADAQH